MTQEMTHWLEQWQQKTKAAFGSRVVCLGLQGSYGRGEATPQSDIDVVLILDEMTYEDLRTYRELMDDLPWREKICGFFGGKEELLCWERGDLFQFYHDTTVLQGTLEFLQPLLTEKDIRHSVHLGGCNIYHMAVHNGLHGQSMEMAQGLLKSAVFVIQAKIYLEQGKYEKSTQTLRQLAQGKDREILDWRLGQKTGDLEKLTELLLLWSGEILRTYGK